MRTKRYYVTYHISPSKKAPGRVLIKLVGTPMVPPLLVYLLPSWKRASNRGEARKKKREEEEERKKRREEKQKRSNHKDTPLYFWGSNKPSSHRTSPPSTCTYPSVNPFLSTASPLPLSLSLSSFFSLFRSLSSLL